MRFPLLDLDLLQHGTITARFDNADDARACLAQHIATLGDDAPQYRYGIVCWGTSEFAVSVTKWRSLVSA